MCAPVPWVGRHCCLWCHITSADLALSPSVRGPVVPRTTQTLESDLDSFKKDGSNLKRAKLFNNVIREPYFPIPLEQASCNSLSSVKSE